MTMTSTTPAFKAFPFAGFVFFNPWVTSYTGSKKLTPADIDLTAADLPPQDLATLGAMHTCDPKKLQPFESARNAQAMACLEFGTRALGGFAVPKEKAEYVAQKLNDIHASFYAYKAEFLADFVLEREKWISLPAFAKWTDRIRERLHTVAYIDDRIQCGYECYTLGDLSDLTADPSSPLVHGTTRAASAIANGALGEIAVLANALIRDSFTDDKGVRKSEVTQKILRPIRKMMDKIQALSFHDPRLKDVGDYVAKQLALLPTSGKMDGVTLDGLYGLVLKLADPQAILAAVSLSDTSVELDDEAQQALLEMSSPAPVAPAPVLDTTPVFDDDGSGDSPAVPASVASPAPAAAAMPVVQQSLILGAPVYDEC